jgi:hypothetical protein
MSTFKLSTEIAAGETWVQVLEELKSGSLSGGDGINRLLERLAANTDVLFAAIQATANSVLSGGGTWDYTGTTLTWSSTFRISWVEAGASVTSNVVSNGSVNFAADGSVVYVVLDRTTDGATRTVQYAASMSALRAAMAASTARADYFLLAYRSGSTIIFADGLRLKQGQQLTSDRGTDNQYAQQSVYDQTERRQDQNHNLRLIGGGTLNWSVGISTGTFAWGSDLHIMVSGTETASNTAQAADYIVAASSIDLDSGEVAYINLAPRDPGAGGVGSGDPRTLQITTYDSAFAGVGSLHDKLIIAYHHDTDGRLYLMNGQSLGDGDSAVLGGAATGLQWRVAEAGPVGGADPLWDFDNPYPVGTGALMVFRNGIKQKASSAVWEGDWPAGDLSDPLELNDDYVEIDRYGNGVGSKILWVRDVDSGDATVEEINAGGTATYRYLDATDPSDGSIDGKPNDPPRQWPDETDFLEAFIGIQGDGPSPVESVGIFGDPGDPVDGEVELEAGLGIDLDYNGGKIRISTSTSGGSVLSLEVAGGAGARTGNLVLQPGVGIAIDNADPAIFSFALAAALSDLLGVSADLEAALVAAYDPSSTNHVLTADAATNAQGFDVVWSLDGSTVYTAGGSLNRVGETSRHGDTSTVTVLDAASPGDAVPSDAPVVNNWIYAYVAHQVGPNEPVLAWGLTPPDRANGFGRHPSGGSYQFLASAWFSGGAQVYPFSKCGNRVTLGAELDVTSAFAAAVATPDGTGFAWQAVSPSLPATVGAVARFRLRVEVLNPATDRGNLLPLYVRPSGFSAGMRRFTSVMGVQQTEEGLRVAQDFVEFEFEALLDDTGSFEISLTDSIYTGSPEVFLVGYDEPRASAAAGARSP